MPTRTRSFVANFDGVILLSIARPAITRRSTLNKYFDFNVRQFREELQGEQIHLGCTWVKKAQCVTSTSAGIEARESGGLCRDL
jgi:hypothetical protein